MAFNENGLHKTYECGGSDVLVNGNKNTVTVHTAASILTKGNNNHVTWVSGVSGTSPSLSNPGRDNWASRVAE